MKLASSADSMSISILVTTALMFFVHSKTTKNVKHMKIVSVISASGLQSTINLVLQINQDQKLVNDLTAHFRSQFP